MFAATTPSRQTGNVLLRLAGGLVLLIVVVLLTAAVALWWMLRTEPGSAWLLSRIPGIEVSAPRGSLLGDFSAAQVALTLPAGRIRFEGLEWDGLRAGLPTWQGSWARLAIERLHADAIDVQLADTPDDGAAPKPPQSLRLPLAVEIGQLSVSEVRADALGERPLRDVSAQVVLGQDEGSRHRIDHLSLAWDRLHLQGTLQIDADAPFATQARLRVAAPASADGNIPAINAQIEANGPLSRLAVSAALRGQPVAGSSSRAAPSLEVETTVLPFAAWPIADLRARTKALDLGALSSALPSTALSGSANIATEGLTEPVRAAIQLDNAKPGRWNDGLLPLRSIELQLSARPEDPRAVEVQQFDARLGSAREPGGRVQGKGRWRAGEASLDMQLADLRPAALDARAPEVQASGPLVARASGLTGPNPAFDLRAQLDGTLPRRGTPQAVHLRIDARGDAKRIEVKSANMQAGNAGANVAGVATRQAGGWRLDGNASVSEFDPAAWWPGDAGSRWRAGPHRLNATLDADLVLPASLWQARAGTPPLERLAGLRGEAALKLAESTIAATRVSGAVRVSAADARSPLALSAQLAIAGSKVDLDGRLARDRDGRRDHWEIDAELPEIARLSPLLGLAGVSIPDVRGALDVDATIDGRWPALRTEGNAAVRALQSGETKVAQATLAWRASTDEDAPLELKADLTGLSIAERRADRASLVVEGSIARHRLVFEGASPVLPPRWIDLLVEQKRAPSATGTSAELRAEGGLQLPAGSDPLRWKGLVQRLELRPRGPGTSQPILATGALPLDVQWSGGMPRVALGASRVQLPGAALHLAGARWHGGASPELAIQARLEPIAVAPLLARLQPGFGWGGDLLVAGTIDVQSAPAVRAQVVFERAGGDLAVTDDSGTLPLSLSDLRFALDAENGVWNFTQALAGSTLGALGGAQTVRTSVQALWPAGDAPLEGVFEARIANLGAWGALVPAGWRLGGSLLATASIGGRFGAPEYTGRIAGSGLSVRNLLEGVSIRDGVIDVRLQGTTARIERAEARAGEGVVRVEGSAAFGASPAAQLRLVAEQALVLGRVDRRIVASGSASVAISEDRLAAGGGFTIDDGLIDFSREGEPDLSADVTVLRPGTSGEPAGAGAPRRARAIALDLRIDLGKSLRLTGRGFESLLAGALHITSPQNRLVVNGSVRAVDGTYAAYGQKLTVERGIVTFTGLPENPRLDILALRPNLDVRVGVAITGTALAPRVRLYSEPEMSDTEKLSWLVLGRASDGAGGAEAALLQRAALGLLAGEGSGPIDRLQSLVGIDDVSVRQSEGTTQETVVSLGKQLSRRWYVGYERSLNATTGTWQLIYRLAQRFTLRAQSGLDNSLDLIWTWRWD